MPRSCCSATFEPTRDIKLLIVAMAAAESGGGGAHRLLQHGSAVRAKQKQTLCWRV